MDDGIVYLVGAGPGDPDLISVKGLRIIRCADVIVFDRLVNKLLLKEARKDAVLIDVGKSRGSRQLSQESINKLLVQEAINGRTVLRLKGGDPFIFGRGSEEALVLMDNGIKFEIVPGVTSAIGVPAYAGIPLTHRGISSKVTIVTGSQDPNNEQSAIDWKTMALDTGTIVILMGWDNLKEILFSLTSNGMNEDTPAAVIQWGTEPYQIVVKGTVGTILEQCIEASITAPVTVVLGQVVEISSKIDWYRGSIV
jgi:uroporphyrinogen III methyltransferase/synthase